MTEKKKEKLLKVNPFWANAKLQMPVGLNAGEVEKKLTVQTALLMCNTDAVMKKSLFKRC